MAKSLFNKTLTTLVDSFYFLFKRFLPLETYRYAVCGGSNLVFDMLLYFTFYNFIFVKENVDLYFIVLSPHIASLFVVFPITFLTGFLLNKHISFKGSFLSTSRQFKRYLMVGFGAIVLNYLLMKFFVDLLDLYPTPSRIISIMITVLYSYTLQNKYTFKRKPTSS